MTIRDLKTFLAAAESHSFVGAARTVRRTQSAVTTQLKTLEESLGSELFDRTKRPLALTRTGQAFLPRAAQVVAAYERLFDDGAPGDQAMEGHLRIGTVPTVITGGTLPRALVALRAKYPNLQVEIAMGATAELLERVRRDSLDAAIVSKVPERGSRLNWVLLTQEPLVLIAPQDAPHLSAEKLIERFAFIRYMREGWLRDLIDRALRRHRLRVREVMMLDTLEAVVTMVHFGLGVSIIPLRSSRSPFSLPVRQVFLKGSPVEREIGLAYPIGHPRGTLIEALQAELRDLTTRDREEASKPRSRSRKGSR